MGGTPVTAAMQSLLSAAPSVRSWLAGTASQVAGSRSVLGEQPGTHPEQAQVGRDSRLAGEGGDVTVGQ